MWGENELVKMACWGSLAPHFINNYYVTAEIICSTAHVHFEVLVWSRATLCCRDMWVPPKTAFYCCITAVSLGSATRGETIAWILLPLLRQPGENTVTAAVSVRREVVWGYVVLCYVCCYNRCGSQERINMSAVPKASCSNLSSGLAYPGFSKQCRQCEQQDNWDCEQDEEQYKRLWRK